MIETSTSAAVEKYRRFVNTNSLKKVRPIVDLGFLVGVGGFHGNVIRFQPSLVIADADLDRAVDALAGALDAA